MPSKEHTPAGDWDLVNLEWVDINLYWKHVKTQDEYNEEIEFIRNAGKEQSALTIAEFGPEDKFIDIPDLDFYIKNMESLEPKLRQRFREYTAEWLDEIKSTWFHNDDIMRLAKHRRYIQACREWLITQPAYIEYNNQHKLRRSEICAKEFRSHPACKAGTQIEVQDSEGVVTKYLIGNVNELGGLCDDCSIDPNSIVLRYRVLLDSGLVGP